MGKLTISGSAKKECSCDVMYITLTFKTWEHDTAKALAQTKSQCDEFLHILEQNGVSLENIHISEDEINQIMDNDELSIEASREINFYFSFNMVLLNQISEIIRENSYTVEMTTSFKLSNEEEIQCQLIKNAVLDSRKKAEMIAQTLNQNIVGMETLRFNDSYSPYIGAVSCNTDFRYLRKPSISDRLSSPLRTIEKSVEVEWIIK